MFHATYKIKKKLTQTLRNINYAVFENESLQIKYLRYNSSGLLFLLLILFEWSKKN